MSSRISVRQRNVPLTCWPILVIVPSPSIDLLTCIVNRFKPMSVQIYLTLIA